MENNAFPAGNAWGKVFIYSQDYQKAPQPSKVRNSFTPSDAPF